jgi:hypothetical protein
MKEQPRINRLRPIEIKYENIMITIFENGDVFVGTDADVTVVKARNIYIENGTVVRDDD